MIGLPGSGKSTYIKDRFAINNRVVCSADNFFIDHKGNYNFDYALLGKAHDKCRFDAEIAMRMNETNIIIDNTNILESHRKPYLELAEMYGYDVQYVYFDCSDAKLLFERNVHKVPLDIIRKI
jgi:predicted kinase